MQKLVTGLVLITGFTLTANADVWKWVDVDGKTHFVDTMKPIYTWRDEFGKVHYSDTPDHEDAVSVELVWYSRGSLDEVPASDTPDEPEEEDFAYPGETEEQRAARKQAESYYCQRATEIYESYINAPQLYRTGTDGERHYLSEEETERTIAETRAKRDELCR